jgi:hypothetical protein
MLTGCKNQDDENQPARGQEFYRQAKHNRWIVINGMQYPNILILNCQKNVIFIQFFEYNHYLIE